MIDIYRDLHNEDGEWDSDLVSEYIDSLGAEFAESPEGVAAAEQLGRVGWGVTFIDLARDYLGKTPPELGPLDVEEVLFDLFPRKVSAEPEEANAIIRELRAFFAFLYRQYGLDNMEDLLYCTNDDAIRDLEKELGDPNNYGFAKYFVMAGKAAGYDMSTQEGLNEFMHVYNATMAARRAQAAAQDQSPRTEAKTTHREDLKKRRKVRKKRRQTRKRPH